MDGKLLIIETQFPTIKMRHPCQMHKITIDNEIKENDFQATLHNRFQLNLNRAASEEYRYSGLFCNKQRFRDWMGQKLCSCYHMNQRRSNLVLDHTTSFVFNNKEIMVPNFSSTEFFKLYLTSNILSSVRARDLRMNEDYFNHLDHTEQVVKRTNGN